MSPPPYWNDDKPAKGIILAILVGEKEGSRWKKKPIL